MSRSKKVVKAEDGTPIEVEGEVSDEAVYPLEDAKTVVWTQKAEDDGVFSEHGSHKAGDLVKTAYADVFVERGYATVEAE